MSVSRRLRFEVLRRDNHACRYCGASSPEVKLTIDHVVPVALGGRDDPANLVTACATCNAGKTSMAPGQALVDDVAQDAVRWARAQRHALDEFLCERDLIETELVQFVECWNIWQINTRSIPLPTGWQSSVRAWLSVGFTVDDWPDLIAKSMQNTKIVNGEKWRYFCGVMWRTIDRLQERTREILAEDAALDQATVDWERDEIVALLSAPFPGLLMTAEAP